MSHSPRRPNCPKASESYVFGRLKVSEMSEMPVRHRNSDADRTFNLRRVKGYCGTQMFAFPVGGHRG